MELTERTVKAVLDTHGELWWNPAKKDTQYMKDLLHKMEKEGKIVRQLSRGGVIKFVRAIDCKPRISSEESST